MKKNNSKKWYTTWWAITLMVIVGLIILGIIIAHFTENVQFGVVNISSDNYKATESESIKQLTAEDCPKSLSYCEGTTEINYSYQFIDGGCVEEIASNENSFDCGYIVPCDLDSCKLKDTNACDGTTKVITAHFCDTKLGCTNRITRDENNTDCGYLFSGKYSLGDLNFIKNTIADCKKYDQLTDCYKGSIDIKFMNDNGHIIIVTPFYETLKQIDNKERLYNKYVDKDIMDLLNINRIDFFVVYYSSKGLFKKAVIKYNEEIYDLKDVTSDYSLSYTYGINRKVVRFNEFSNFWDKEVELVIILNESNKLTEYSKMIDLNKYK